MVNQFKGAQGHFLTKALFYETNVQKDNESTYTLKDDDYQVGETVYPSLRKIYVALGDPTEYRVATEALGGWGHWKKLCECGWFREHLDEWREELDAKLRAEALVHIREDSKDKDSRNYFTANKILLDGGWEKKEPKGGVGRTTKQKIKQEAEKLFSKDQDVVDDFKRMMN